MGIKPGWTGRVFEDFDVGEGTRILRDEDHRPQAVGEVDMAGEIRAWIDPGRDPDSRSEAEPFDRLGAQQPAGLTGATSQSLVDVDPKRGLHDALAERGNREDAEDDAEHRSVSDQAQPG